MLDCRSVFLLHQLKLVCHSFHRPGTLETNSLVPLKINGWRQTVSFREVILIDSSSLLFRSLLSFQISNFGHSALKFQGTN